MDRYGFAGRSGGVGAHGVWPSFGGGVHGFGGDNGFARVAGASSVTSLLNSAAAGKQTVLFPVELDHGEYAEIMRTYADYEMLPLSGEPLAKDLFSAHRFMAMHLAVDRAHVRSLGVKVLGDGLFQCATRDVPLVSLLGDADNLVCSAVAADSTEVYVETSKSRVAIEKKLSYRLPSHIFRDFLQLDAFVVETDLSRCFRDGAGIAIDLSMHSLSVDKVCEFMAASACSRAEVFIPYVKDAELKRSGVLPSSGGVSFEVGNDCVSFNYPHGYGGVTHYDLEKWNKWLKEGDVPVVRDGFEYIYRVKPGDVRGPFRFIEIECLRPQSFATELAAFAGLPVGSISSFFESGSGRFASGLRREPATVNLRNLSRSKPDSPRSNESTSTEWMLAPVPKHSNVKNWLENDVTSHLPEYYKDQQRVAFGGQELTKRLTEYEGTPETPASPVFPLPLNTTNAVPFDVVQVSPPVNADVAILWDAPVVNLDKPYGFVNVKPGLYKILCDSEYTLIVPIGIGVSIDALNVRANPGLQTHVMLFATDSHVVLSGVQDTDILLWYDTGSRVWCAPHPFPLTSKRMCASDYKPPTSYTNSPVCGTILSSATSDNGEYIAARTSLPSRGYIGGTADSPVLLMKLHLPKGVVMELDGTVVFAPTKNSGLYLCGRVPYKFLKSERQIDIEEREVSVVQVATCGERSEDTVWVPNVGMLDVKNMDGPNHYRKFMRH